MSTIPEISIEKLLVTGQKFTAHNSKPQDGKGFVNWHFEDNRKDCLCASSDSICWQASLTVKAFSSAGEQPDQENDLLLMEAVVSLEGEFSINSPGSCEEVQSLTWYFDRTCKQKLISKMRLLLIDTEFATIPLPANA